MEVIETIAWDMVYLGFAFLVAGAFFSLLILLKGYD